MSSSAELLPNGVHDGVLRPRPRKLVHSQLSQLSNASANGYLDAPESGMTRSTDNPPPCLLCERELS